MALQGALGSKAVRAQAEAAAWMALLHSPERDERIEGGLRRWIDADPEHAVAWELATDLWNNTVNLKRYMPKRRVPWGRFGSRRLVPVLTVCAICFVLVCIGVRYFHGSTVATGIGEQRTLSLDDGSRVQLNTATSLKVDFDGHTRKIILSAGEAYFQVAHESRPFVVVAGDRKVIALGTEFTVRRDETSFDAVTVTLIEGRVAVAPTDGENALPSRSEGDVAVLTVGQRLRVRPHQKPTLDAPSLEKMTGWMRGQVVFDHTPLREAAAEISRYSHRPVLVDSAAVADIKIGGIFRVGDTNSFAVAVAKSHNLRAIARGKSLVLTEEASASGTP